MHPRHVLPLTLALIALLLSPPRTHAQFTWFTAFGSRAFDRANVVIRDSLADDAQLVSVSSGPIDLLTGRSRAWTYAFYSVSSRKLRSVLIDMPADTLRLRFLGSGTLDPQVRVDTLLPFANSDRMAERLAANSEFQRYRTAYPSDSLTSAQLARYSNTNVELPPTFDLDAPIWQIRFARVGEWTFTCAVSPESGETFCTTYYDTNSVFRQKKSRRSGVEFYATNYGVFGHNVTGNAPGFSLPRGSNFAYIYGAGFWFGTLARDGGEIVPNVMRSYNPNSGVSYFKPGETSGRPYQWAPDLFHSDDFNRTSGMNEAKPFEQRWPLWLAASDDAPSLMSPGRFVSRNSERGGELLPAFVGITEQFVSTYRDDDPARFEGVSNSPIGLAVQENIFAPTMGDYSLSVIVQYQVINKSGERLSSCVMGSVTDYDIGTAIKNDFGEFYASRPELRTVVGTTGTEPRSGYGALAITILESPTRGNAARVDNARRSAYRADGRIETFRNWTLEDDPASTEEAFALLTSGQIDQSTLPQDARVLIADETFAMEPGDTAWLAVAYSVFPDQATVSAGDRAFEQYIDGLIGYYYDETPSHVDAVDNASEMRLSVHPNPARETVRIRLAAPASSPSRLVVFNALGRIVSTIALEAGDRETMIDLSDFASGVYCVTTTSSGVVSTTRFVVR